MEDIDADREIFVSRTQVEQRKLSPRMPATGSTSSFPEISFPRSRDPSRLKFQQISSLVLRVGVETIPRNCSWLLCFALAMFTYNYVLDPSSMAS
ncbi:hypothetical protein CPSG_05890 [Coccidioides posadasii str. Silveira]|uniref:Uncharacterized protein n=1 Tax=Coccidioides posadasii (strain RMSCC 757 / Silveira) TaxID=443226 RepID=E9D7T8_COCPS|nr:hypothetical protein CPSG_05890 [Coccidioides posadasii str. Silveira]